MDSLKKVISLNQAAQISGYTQDYLGYLVRKGEIHGMKKGRSWFTTEEEINNYIFKKKIKHKEFAIKDFFSPTRTKNIIIATIVIIVVSFFVFSNLQKKEVEKTEQVKSAINSDGEPVIIK